MRTRHRLRALTGVLLTLGFATAAFAATAEEMHRELRELKTAYEHAINSGDLAPLAPLFDADSGGVTVDNQTFRSFAELKAIYDGFHAKFPGVEYRIALQPAPSVLVGDLAIATGTADEYVKTAAGEFRYTSSFTVVLRRTPAGWKLVRSQVTMDPFRNSIVVLFEQRAKLTYGLLGLGGGALLGAVAGIWIARRRSAAAPATSA